MIANLANTAVGLALVYCAILDPRLLEGQPGRTATIAVVIAALALWARRTESDKWLNGTNVALAGSLLALGLLQSRAYTLLTFWGLFWIGILVAVLALWSLLLRRAQSQPPAG
jgi:hypothetical protein